MTDYVKSTNFAAKDNLTTGDPNKRVRGSEIDDEYNNIATAVSSKANAHDAALTGAPTAPTATAGTNSTQLATTAYADAAVAANPSGVADVIVNGTASTLRTIYVDDTAATGGEDGDIWFEY